MCAMLVNGVVPDPYMDEIFHIPQAQQFCRGDFSSWNPMITTFPGLYLTSVGLATAMLPAARLTNLAGNVEALCSVAFLRSVNILLGFVCCLLFYQIIRQTEPGVSSSKASAKVLVMAFYPLHWFFTFLYYTDVGSTTAVMAMYLACLRKSYWMSGLFGAVSIMFRQTNIVWTIFVTCTGLLDLLGSSHRLRGREPKGFNSVSKPRPVINAAVTRRRSDVDVVLSPSFRFESNAIQVKGLRDDCKGVVSEAYHLVKLMWLKRRLVVWNFAPLLAVIFTFFSFVLYNGGIVVGDKEAHRLSLHFPQLLYFGLATAAMLSPLYLAPRRAWAWVKSGESFFGYALAFGIALVFVHYFTYAHPYLLADNRHYTFYLWRKVISVHWSSKYMLLPAYVLSWSCILHGLGKTKSSLWIITFLLGVAGVLVPTPLFEIRYYTIPFYITFVHSSSSRKLGSVRYFIIGACFVMVNAVTLYIFLFRPFQWAHEQGVQRFMW